MNKEFITYFYITNKKYYRTMQIIVEMIRNKSRSSIDLEQVRKLPKNLVSSLLRILSKRGYLNDENIYAVSVLTLF